MKETLNLNSSQLQIWNMMGIICFGSAIQCVNDMTICN